MGWGATWSWAEGSGHPRLGVAEDESGGVWTDELGGRKGVAGSGLSPGCAERMGGSERRERAEIRKHVDSSTGKRPGIFYFEARHKHDAWARIATAFGGRPDDAKARYVEIARASGWKGVDAPESPEPETEAEVPKRSGGMGFGPSVSVMAREEGQEE